MVSRGMKKKHPHIIAYMKGISKRIKNWHKRGKSIYVYFNNDIEGWAIKNSLELKGMLGGEGKT